jgi:MFS transporter, DHA3 family, macrolide efflux protein
VSSGYEAPPNGWRTFLIVWVTQSISVFGSALTFFAMTIWLTQVMYPAPEQKPQLAAAISLIALAWGIPAIFGAPIAGAWADRHDRKRTMIAMDLVNGVISLIVMMLIVTGIMQLGMLIVLMATSAIAGAFHNAAFDTSYAMIVPEEQLPRANGMMQTIWALSGILSPAIAATIIALPNLARQGVLPGPLAAPLSQMTDGTALCIAIDAMTFFMAAAVLVFLTIPSPKRTDLAPETGRPSKSLLADVAEGARYIWHRRPMLWLLGTFTVINFVASPVGVFLPLMVKFNLAPDWTRLGMSYEAALALISTAYGLGGLAGGIFISAWGGLKRRRVYGVIVSAIVVGAVQIVFGLSPWLYLTMICAFVIDSMTPIMNAHSQAIWQSQTPRELQGRVFSVRRLIAQFTVPISTALAGIFGGLFNPGMVVAVLGFILLVFAIAQMFNPYLLRVEDKEYLDALAAQAEAAG